MKLYKFDKHNLAFIEISKLPFLALALGGLILVIVLSAFAYKGEPEKEIKKIYVKGETEVVVQQTDTFSTEKLVKLIKELHIKHPEIVYTQFVFESGHFTSPLFKNQNNLMGMRIATSRPTTAIGENDGYAVYKTWRDCVIDYALYQSSFLRGASKEEYYHYLQKVYAKNPHYTKEIKDHIKNKKIKELFR